MVISDKNLYIISCVIATLGFSISLLIFGHFVIHDIIGKLIMKKDLYHLDNEEDKYHFVAGIAITCNAVGVLILAAMTLVLIVIVVVFIIAVVGAIIYRQLH